MIVCPVAVGIHRLIIKKETKQARLAEEGKISMSEIHDEVYSNSQDDPSTIIRGFAAPVAPHSGSKPHSRHLDPPEASQTTVGKTYVDYICRLDDEQNATVGIVEIVGSQEEKPFRSLEELLTILDTAKVGAVIKWER